MFQPLADEEQLAVNNEARLDQALDIDDPKARIVNGSGDDLDGLLREYDAETKAGAS